MIINYMIVHYSICFERKVSETKKHLKELLSLIKEVGKSPLGLPQATRHVRCEGLIPSRAARTQRDVQWLWGSGGMGSQDLKEDQGTKSKVKGELC